MTAIAMTNKGAERLKELRLVTQDSQPCPLVQELLDTADIEPTDLDYDAVRWGVEALLTRTLESETPDQIDVHHVDAFIAWIDSKLAEQLNAVLHHEEFQRIESAWRSLAFLLKHTPSQSNVEVDVLHVGKSELAEDFAQAAELQQSVLYERVYSDEYGVFGGRPYGLLCGDYAFDPSPDDTELLGHLSEVAEAAHAPFIANAGPRFFGLEHFGELPQVHDLASVHESPRFAAWRGLRERDSSRYIGLCLPRFMLRRPYRLSGRAPFIFDEAIDEPRDYLWGHASTALVSRVIQSFTTYGWCPNIIGPRNGGTVGPLPIHHFEAMGDIVSALPTEVLLTERREVELADQGFIGLTHRKGSDEACFFSANAIQRPKRYGLDAAGREAETNARLGAQLPYVLIISRLAHYIKVMQRENLGSWKEKEDLERELSRWLSQYVADMDSPAPGVRARRPLRRGRIHVSEIDGNPGWYRCKLEVQPHMKYMGAAFTLSLVSQLEG